MTATSTLRSWWAPACSGPFARLNLFGGGAVTVRTPIVSAVHALDDCLRVHGYRTRVEDTGAYNCRKITGGSNWSLHAYGIAIDINWQSNPYGKRLVTDMPPEMIEDIKKIRTKNGKRVWRWGGDYINNKDAMHFEVICHPSDLATGIDPATLPGRSNPTPPPSPPETKDDDMVDDIRQLHEVFLGANPDPRQWSKDMLKSFNYHLEMYVGGRDLNAIRGDFARTAGV